jgi:hypothetical protein
MLPRGVCGNNTVRKTRLEGDSSVESFRTIRMGHVAKVAPAGPLPLRLCE